ncbi:MAG TPA: TIR domain-containing protein [Candidatus Kapabacteria bacterium]|nr:TIR domain-containing protein [Candidatus Kapabacteria bacterium]
MAFITTNTLEMEKALYGDRLVQKALNESRERQSHFYEATVFLSHKHDEEDKLEGASALLKRSGAEVYIDHMDVNMPKITSAITARRLKEKIKTRDKFIFLATGAAIRSKWCNWELGYGDANKDDKNIALLIIEEYNDQWKGSEYLQLYPVIQEIEGEYLVIHPDGNYCYSLKDWLVI